MAWSTPITAVSNTALSAAQWNQSVRDNLLASPNGIATTAGSHFAVTATNTIAERQAQTVTVATLEDTGGTTGSYTNLATSGPQVTATTGVLAWSHATCQFYNDTTNVNTFFSVDISGATTDGASDTRAGIWTQTASQPLRFTVTVLHSLTAGSNVFKIRYKANSNNGYYSRRVLAIMPL